jgi:hypothetical protein
MLRAKHMACNCPGKVQNTVSLEIDVIFGSLQLDSFAVQGVCATSFTPDSFAMSGFKEFIFAIEQKIKQR